MRFLILFIATGAGSGYSPVAPGTAGSVVGLLMLLVVGNAMNRHPLTAVAIFVVIFLVSCWISGEAERIFDEPDSSKIVIDEVLGMFATMYLNPLGWKYLIAGFLLFRLLDIIKPFPANWADRRGGGTGVMLDDLFAAIYANLILRVAALVI